MPGFVKKTAHFGAFSVFGLDPYANGGNSCSKVRVDKNSPIKKIAHFVYIPDKQ